MGDQDDENEHFLPDTVTELSAATGASLQTPRVSTNSNGAPSAVAADGTHVWVTNFNSRTLSEIAPGS